MGYRMWDIAAAALRLLPISHIPHPIRATDCGDLVGILGYANAPKENVMRVSCLQENLAHGLSLVSRAVSTRSALPVLGNILLAAENGRLKLAATNLEIGITCWIGAQVEEEGAVTVPARTLVDLVNSLPAEPVGLALTVRTQTLNLRCARTQANIRHRRAGVPDHALGRDAGDDDPDGSADSGGDRPDRVRRGDRGHPPDPDGVHARFQGQQVSLAAADGYRCRCARRLAEPIEQPLTMIIPARALNELLRVSGEGEEGEAVTIKLPAGRNQVLFHLGTVDLVSQLIEGNYPDYGQIIPKSHTTRTVMSVAEFRKACKTSDIFARESAHTARLKIAPGSELSPGHLTIIASSAETGDNVAELDANVEGQPVEIAFNVRYLLEALNAIDTGQVALETSGPNSPGRLVPVGRDDFQHVVMPMHIGR
jgi:DNA polymerase-3 subunit beta